MVYVEIHCAVDGIFMPLKQGVQCLDTQDLAALQLSPGFLLRNLPVYPGPLVLKVKKEPEFKTRIRYSDGYLMAPGQVERSRQLKMLVDVEHTPNLVVATAPTASLVPLLLTLLFNRSCHNRDRRTPEWIDGDENVLPKAPRPVHDVALFSSQALHEHMQMNPLCSFRGAWKLADPRHSLASFRVVGRYQLRSGRKLLIREDWYCAISTGQVSPPDRLILSRIQVSQRMERGLFHHRSSL